MPFLLGIDLGTSSLKAMLITPGGTVVGQCARQYQFDVPALGHAEQDPQVWWRACCEALNELLASAPVAAKDIAALSFSGQMHGTVMLDKANRVIRPVILHNDTRSSAQCRFIRDALGRERLLDWIKNPIYSGFMLPSLLWMREHEPDRYGKISKVLLPKDYLRYKICGELASDCSDASATLLFDIEAGDWSPSLLSTFQIDPSILPTVHAAWELAGRVTAAAAAETGLAEGTPVVYGGGDQIMQAIGNGVIGDGRATVNVGSSGQVCFPSRQLKINPALNSNLFCGFERGHWISMAATMSAGMSLSWWNKLISPRNWDDVNQGVAAVPPGSRGLLFLPYLGGERSPHLNPDLSASFVGITHGTTNDDMTRSVMEGVTYALNDCMNICLELGLEAEMLVASGGGANSKPWLQMQADVFNEPLMLAENKEQAALGAAIVAGVGAGVYKSVPEACAQVVRYQDRIIQPDAKRHDVYMEYYQLFRMAFATQKDVIEQLTLLGAKTYIEKAL